MPDAADTPPLEDLLAHVGWIRRLSRRLVRDPDLADEVVQQTLLRAAHSGPREPSSLRAWLGALVRNFARAGLRARARREHHEQRASRPERQPSTHEVVERAALQRELVDCVMSLDEPYRTTVLLRYFEGQSSREIAARQGIPAATVRTHLARGLALLRARLDRRHGGDRSAWAWIALPMPAVPLTPWVPILAMNVKTIATVALLGTAGLALLLVSRGAPEPQQPAGLEAPLTRASLDLANDPAVPTQPLQRRQADVSPEAAHPAPATAPIVEETTSRVVVRVVDGLSVPVAGVAVVLAPMKHDDAMPSLLGGRAPAPSSEVERAAPARVRVGTTDASGSFSLDRPAREARLDVDDPRWVAVLTGIVGMQADQRTCTIVVAPAEPLDGIVNDDAGVPVAGAEVSVQPQFHFRARLQGTLESSEDVVVTLRTGADGRFSFARLPLCDGLRLEASAVGHVSFGAALAAADRPFQTITLTRTSQSADVLRGRVVDDGSMPVPGAIVALGLDTTTADERGEFAIPKNGPGRKYHPDAPVEVRALAPGHLPGAFVPPMNGREPVWPEFVTLRLGGAPLALSGRVERADGTAASGVRVWLADTTTFGESPNGMLQLEGWLAGDDQNAWHYATTSADGTFRLEGLLARDYRVCAVDPATLERTELERVTAGRVDVRLRFAADRTVPRIDGVVVDAQGEPVPDVRVVPFATTFLATYAGRNLFSTSVSLEGTVTDADGKFELRGLPWEGVTLNFTGDGVLTRTLPLEYDRARDGDVRTLRVEIERRMLLQVELADPTSADAFALLDADGKELSLAMRMGTTTYFFERPPIRDGRSHVVSGSDRARTIVSFKGDQEVQRRSVQLSATETTILRL